MCEKHHSFLIAQGAPSERVGLLQDTHTGQEQPKQADTNMPDSPAGLRDRQLVLRQKGRAGMPNQHQAKGMAALIL